MKERQQLLGVLVGLHGWHPDQANTLIDNFAHGLAEQQRAALGDVMDRWFGNLHQDAFSELIDVIDPKAQRAATEGDNT